MYFPGFRRNENRPKMNVQTHLNHASAADQANLNKNSSSKYHSLDIVLSGARQQSGTHARATK